MKKIFYLLTFALLLVGCNNATSNESSDGKDKKEEAAYVFESEDLKVSKDKDGKAILEGNTDALEKIDQSKLTDGEAAIYVIIDTKYKENFYNFFNSESFQFDLKQITGQYDLISNAVKAYSFGEKDFESDWEAFKNELIETSKVYENFDGARKPIIRVINPYNANMIVLVVEDGEVLYDFAQNVFGDAGKEGFNVHDPILGK